MEIEIGAMIEWAHWVMCNMCTVLSVTQALTSDREWPMVAITLFFLFIDRPWHPVRYTLDRAGFPDTMRIPTVGITVIIFEVYMLNEAMHRPVPVLTHVTPFVGVFVRFNTLYAAVIGVSAIILLAGMIGVGFWIKCTEAIEALGGVGTIELTLSRGTLVLRPRSLLDQIEKIAPVHRNEPPPEGSDMCSICLNALTEERFWRKTPCNHLFHADCADYWWRSHMTCPMCNQRLDTFGNNVFT